jgi:hypothetical protein
MRQQEATVYCPFINRSRVHGINSGAKEAVWLRSLLGELQIKEVKKLTQMLQMITKVHSHDLPLRCCLLYLAIDELDSPCSTQAKSNCSRSHTFLASRQIIHKANRSAVTRLITSLVQLLEPSSLPCVGSSSKGNTLLEFVNLVPSSRGGVEGFCRRF